MKRAPQISRPIGGYFALEAKGASRSKCEWLDGAIAYQSARAALLALLRFQAPRKIWLPWYICPEMVDTVKQSGVPMGRYAIDKDLLVDKTLGLHRKDWLVFINYFGVNGKNVDTTLKRFPSEQIIIDNAQAFYAVPRKALANLYSPRKFFGVPDGGYLLTDIEIPPPETADMNSENRMEHLYFRNIGEIEKGYAAFHLAEKSFGGVEPQAMSSLTRNMLTEIDYAAARMKRLQNFASLAGQLNSSNEYPVELGTDDVPMCYPYVTMKTDLRKTFIQQLVYVPAYWPGVGNQIGVPRFESSLAEMTLPLPIDQRYDENDMSHILSVKSLMTQNQN